MPDEGIEKQFFPQSGSGTYLAAERGLRWVVSEVDAVRSEAGVPLASVGAYRSVAADAGDRSQVPPCPREVPSRSWLPSGERCGGQPEPCEGLYLWSGRPVLLGAEASRRSDRWSEDPFSATQGLLGLFRGAYRSHGHPEPGRVPGTLPGPCPGEASPV